MKKRLSVLLCLALISALTGCGDSSSAGRSGTQPAGVNDVLEAEMADQDSSAAPASGTADASSSAAPASETADADSSAAPASETADQDSSAAPASEMADQDSSAAPASETADAEGTEPVKKAGAAAEGTGAIDVDLTALSSTMVYSEVYNMMVSPESYIGKTVKMDGAFAVYHDEAKDINYYACLIADATACCSQGIEFVLSDGYTYPEDYPELGGEICVVGVFDTYQEGNANYCTLRNAQIV